MSTDAEKQHQRIVSLFRQLFPDPDASATPLQGAKLAEAADELQKQRVREATARADEQEQRNEQRFKYARRFFLVSVGWLILVGLIVLANGFTCIPFYWFGAVCIPFSLDNSVLITLLTTTTFKVIGPAYLIANYLFRSGPEGPHGRSPGSRS